MVPQIYPDFYNLFHDCDKESIWFSLGLANIVIFEDKTTYSDSVIKQLTDSKNITGYERWEMDDQQFTPAQRRMFKLVNNVEKYDQCEVQISTKLPLYLKFTVSEFIISVDKLLKASKKFTPHYYKRHVKTVQVLEDFVNDLGLLHGDQQFEPSVSTLSFLHAKNKKEVLEKLADKNYEKKIKELINEWHGKIVQFNSSLSYIYSQAYAGTFPIFDHIGIVRRHSLLGLGTAISSLYELMIQLEAAFIQVPFRKIANSPYHSENVPTEYIDLIVEPTKFNPKLWSRDTVRGQMAEEEIAALTFRKEPEDYYNRLSFYSGRLGFREYDFAATGAIQVVVESHTLPWHIINYTHEIIHSHVRYLLQQLYMVPNSIRKESQEEFLKKVITQIETIYENYGSVKKSYKFTYHQYFVIVLFKFVINARIFGSLSTSCDDDLVTEIHTNDNYENEDTLPDALTLFQESLEYTKDISEIFVHVIDYNYIYKKQLKIYLMSIWSSWATIPAVGNDLKHYILRSLIIVGLNIDGETATRFETVKNKFSQLLAEINETSPNVIFDSIFKTLNTKPELDDLKYRFINCIIVGDLVNNFCR